MYSPGMTEICGTYGGWGRASVHPAGQGNLSYYNHLEGFLVNELVQGAQVHEQTVLGRIVFRHHEWT